MLHIHNGDSSADIARSARIPGEHIGWREALVCGPAPGALSPDAFREVRAQHLSESYDLSIEDVAEQLRRQQEALAQYRDHEEVVLWFEHDLFCQVHLVHLLDWFASHAPGTTRLSLICIDRFPGVPNFRGLGQLSETQLASLVSQRTEITEAQLQLGQKAWTAYTSSTPAAGESVAVTENSGLPFLAQAFAKHLQRFPSKQNGLGRVQNVLLELIGEGHQEFTSLFGAFQDREPLYGFGDTQIFLELKALATASTPLLLLNLEEGAPARSLDQISRATFQITETGKAVLDGKADFVSLNGIDLWLGGVHLKGVEAQWRWDETLSGLVRSREKA